MACIEILELHRLGCSEAVSYLVESTEGYMASLYARFQQATSVGRLWQLPASCFPCDSPRHDVILKALSNWVMSAPSRGQVGIQELKAFRFEVFLQWFRLSSSVGFLKIPWRTSEGSGTGGDRICHSAFHV